MGWGAEQLVSKVSNVSEVVQVQSLLAIESITFQLHTLVTFASTRTRAAWKRARLEGAALTWQVFYIFGGAGLVWSWWWESLLSGLRKTAPEMMASLEDVEESPSGGNKAGVPWRAFFRNTPVRALAYVHFCNNWWAISHAACMQHVRTCHASAQQWRSIERAALTFH